VFVKPGYKTTEFYGATATGIGLVSSALADALSTANAAKYGSVVAVGYAIARAIAKAIPQKAPTPGP
jgi:hypothetical protein